MTKETDGIEIDDRERRRKEQCSDKKDEGRRLRGRRASARKTTGETTTENMTCRKVTGEKVTVDNEGGTMGRRGEERSTCDRRKDEWKKRSEIRCVD